jgi:hypothetical protein
MCCQLVRKIADLSLSSLLQRSAKYEAFRGQILAQARAAGSTEEAAGCLKLISEIGTNDGVQAAFELAGGTGLGTGQ